MARPDFATSDICLSAFRQTRVGGSRALGDGCRWKIRSGGCWWRPFPCSFEHGRSLFNHCAADKQRLFRQGKISPALPAESTWQSLAACRVCRHRHVAAWKRAMATPITGASKFAHMRNRAGQLVAAISAISGEHSQSSLATLATWRNSDSSNLLQHWQAECKPL